MIKISLLEDCCGCSACAQKCPQQCIEMCEDSEGFVYPQLDTSRCVNCHLCEKVCPIINNHKSQNPLHAYAVQHNDDTILHDSSSGGAFSLLAAEILKKNGVVYGACFNDNFESVFHNRITNIEELSLLRGSKYLQSDINGTFKRVEQDLYQNKLVLFSGLPCQIMALRTFLQKNFDMLYTVDLICHGVPSPKIWRYYLHNIVYENNKSLSTPSIESLSFREKSEGWRDYKLWVRFEKGNGTYSTFFYNDAYMQLFLNDVILRPSCYKCKAKEGRSHSDITLGDFWQINCFDKNIDDNRGLSLVLVNSKKGDSLIKKTDCIVKEFQVKQILGSIGPWKISAHLHEMRRFLFSKNLELENFDIITRHILHPALHIRVIRKILRIIGVKQMPV